MRSPPSAVNPKGLSSHRIGSTPLSYQREGPPHPEAATSWTPPLYLRRSAIGKLPSLGRWVVLLIFSLGTAMLGALWNTVGPIASIIHDVSLISYAGIRTKLDVHQYV